MNHLLKKLRRISMDWVTVEDASYVLKISPRRILELIHEGKLEAGRIGQTTVIYHEDLEAFAKLDRPAGRPIKVAE